MSSESERAEGMFEKNSLDEDESGICVMDLFKTDQHVGNERRRTCETTSVPQGKRYENIKWKVF